MLCFIDINSPLDRRLGSEIMVFKIICCAAVGAVLGLVAFFGVSFLIVMLLGSILRP
jgi:hypothetical protein